MTSDRPLAGDGESPPDHDWAVFTSDRKTSLWSALVRLLHVYENSTASLQVLVRTAAKAIQESERSTASVIRKLAGEELEEDRPRPGERVANVDFDEDQMRLLRRVMSDFQELHKPLPQMINEMAVVYAVALFEGVVADVYTTVLSHVPGRLRLERQLTYQEALEHATREDLIIDLARRATRAFTDLSLSNQIQSLKQTFGVDLTKEGSIDQEALGRIFLLRNLFVHNSGVVTREYARATGGSSSVGSRATVSEEKFIAANRELGNLARSIIDGFAAQLCDAGGKAKNAPRTPSVEVLRKRLRITEKQDRAKRKRSPKKPSAQTARGSQPKSPRP